MWHPETELTALLRGELSGPDYDRVTEHLAACAECRSLRGDLQSIVRDLSRTASPPPPVAWARYRAELHSKLAARARHRRSGWWRWPAPLALATGLAAVLVFLALEGGRAPYTKNAATFDEAVIGRRLELLRDYRVVERLDLLEDWEILRSLDGPTGRREG